VTTVPALGLSMVSAVDPATRERILDALEPKLRAFVKNIRSQPGRYHVLVPTVSTVRDGDLVQAIFACGLGEEYAAAASISRSEVRALVRRMATQSRKARGAGEAANLGANMLADGYETRIPRHLATRCGGSPLVVGPEAPRALRPVISPQSPVKSYSLPVSPAPRRPR